MLVQRHTRELSGANGSLHVYPPSVPLERSDDVVAQAACRNGLHREEIHGPERLGMPLYEVVPLVRCPIRGRLDAFFLQDVPWENLSVR